MNETLPPPALVKTWLDLIEKKCICKSIKNKRLKLIEYYFNTAELARLYVDLHQYNHKKAS